MSGIQEDKNHEILWYKKSFEIETNGKERVLLHFGAVDYHAMIFLNGGLVCEHEGGHTSFSVDITDFLDRNKKGQSLAVRVYDPLEDELIPEESRFGRISRRASGIREQRASGRPSGLKR